MVENNGKIKTQIPITDKDSQEIIIDVVMEGKSAYDMAVEKGFDGTLEEWLLSLHGKDGKDADVDGIQAQFDTVEERLDSTDAQLNDIEQDFTQHKLDYAELVQSEHKEYRSILNIIPPDGNPNVCHPSVVKIDGGWNGYVYWMAYTPFPEATRENPHIIASHNGIDWVEPKGINNPVVPLEHITSMGWNYNSDVELLYVGGKLELYYRTVGKNEAIYRRTSEDGINWTNETQLLVCDRNTLLSPTVVFDNDVYYLWCLNRNTTPAKVIKYESSDGISFGLVGECSMNGFVYNNAPWHFQIRKVSGYYHLLCSEYNTWKLYYGKSIDGVNFDVDTSADIINRDTSDFPSDGFYRASFVANYGGVNGVTFDVWANIAKSGISMSSNDSQHRIAYYKDVDLIGGTKKIQTKDFNRLWIPATQFSTAYGDTLVETQNQQLTYLRIKNAARTRVSTTFIPPQYMDKIKVKIYFVNKGEGVGNVRFTVTLFKCTNGGDIKTLTPLGSNTIHVQSKDLDILDVCMFFVGRRDLLLTTGEVAFLRVEREGNNALDTLSNDIGFIGAEINYI